MTGNDEMNRASATEARLGEFAASASKQGKRIRLSDRPKEAAGFYKRLTESGRNPTMADNADDSFL